jgi:soluble lytic murein transglycosylase
MISERLLPVVCVAVLATAAVSLAVPTPVDRATAPVDHSSTTAAIPPTTIPPAAGPTLDSQTTAGIVISSPGRTSRLDFREDGRLKQALDDLAIGDLDAARAVRDDLPRDRLEHHILAWAIAMRGGSGLTAAELANAESLLASWPGATTLRRNLERALLKEAAAPRTVIDALGAAPPLTTQGAIALARAHLLLGDTSGAKAVLIPFWRTEKLEASEETAVLREFSGLIPASEHRFRMERMLYADRVNSAKRVAALADSPALFDAWAAVIRGDKAAARLLDVVPEAQRSAGYDFAKARMLRRAGKYVEAAKVMAEAPTNGSRLVDPDTWWVERRALSRELLDLGDAKGAYRIAAAHAAESPANQADAEFHAGWYALRHLADSRAAARHFGKIAAVAEGPISRARAYYWMGRAAEAGGPGNATELYIEAARYGTTFYGQLAAARTGKHRINVVQPAASPQERATFAEREAVRAITRLERAGQQALADTLYRDLASQLDSPGELSLLAQMAERRDNHHLALRIGKIAAQRGIDVGGLSHPVGAIPATADISGSGKALAYAIARQESEFNVGAVSGAGARGLLQLMPGTAREVASRTGLAYSAQRLVSDAGYNATLGAAFLGEQLGRFDGSYILTFVGYNAGPKRARDWMARYGDPRGKDIDQVVDWVERIPFTETRSYVQRVMENYQVYKMRLTGEVDIERDLIRGR